MPKWIASLIGKFVGRRLKLKEDKEMSGTTGTKSWWASKSIWTAIVTGLLGIYMTLQPAVGLPVLPEWLFALLGAMGIYTRVAVTKTIA